MTLWRIVEGTNDEGHPGLCKWDLLYVSEYDTILNPEFFKTHSYKRIKFSISNKMPDKNPLFRKLNRREDDAG